MNLFEALVNTALKNQPELFTLKIAVEKELLQHDILRVLSQHNLLKDLTFIGGTCLRACYGSQRLSEDLDFTGGKDFTRASLSQLSHILSESLHKKYALPIKISEPMRDKKNVSTWKITIETRLKQKHLPAQRINLDICAVPSYDRRPMMLINHYGVDLGTNSLIIQVQTREEIYADKIIAFALRPNRLKYRDLWDIIWLQQQGIKPSINLIPNKLQDRNYKVKDFFKIFDEREQLLKNDNKQMQLEFQDEMRRFLATEQLLKITENNHLWEYIIVLIADLKQAMHNILKI